MAMITLHNASLPEVTILSNTFIDNYMPEDNGEFVKVYIYLLRELSSAQVFFSLEPVSYTHLFSSGTRISLNG